MLATRYQKDLICHNSFTVFLLSRWCLEICIASGVAVAKAAHIGSSYIFSNQASKVEEWRALMIIVTLVQLYWSKSNDLVASLVQRAEKCGCSAIVVTLDTTLLGWRTRDLELAYLPFMEGKGIAQYTSDPVFLKMLDEQVDETESKRKITLQSLLGLIGMVRNYPDNGFFKKLKSGKPIKAVQKFVSTYSNPCTKWNDLKFLRQHTAPILLKVSPSRYAQQSNDFGMDGIIFPITVVDK